MSRRVSITASLLSILIAGCASITRDDTTAVEATQLEVSVQAVPDAVIHQIIRESIQVTECRRTQRDLSVDWLSRQYLCSHGERLVALQTYNDGGHLLHRRKIKPLLADNTDIEKSTITPAFDVKPSPQEMVQYHVVIPMVKQHADKANSQPSVKASGNKKIVKIAFVENKELLDLAGINQSLSLIPTISEARRITLLGVYEQSEIDAFSKLDTDPQKRERFSVGRALSIRKLWLQEGVDPSKIMIMHHRDHRSGRYVEIVIHG